MPKKFRNSYQYSDEEEATLIRLFNEFLNLGDIGLALGRSRHSVCRKVNKMGLTRDHRIVPLVTKYGPDVVKQLSFVQGKMVLIGYSKGHPYDEVNTYVYTCKQTGRVYHQCRVCRKLRAKRKYMTNAAHREKEIIRARNYRQLGVTVHGSNSERANTGDPAQTVKG